MINTKINIINYRKIKNKAFEIYYILNLIPFKKTEENQEEIFIKRSIKKICEFINSIEVTKKDFDEITNLLDVLDKNYIFDYYLSSIEKSFCEQEIIKYEDNAETYKIPELDLIIEKGEFLQAYIAYRIAKLKENKDKEKKLTK